MFLLELTNQQMLSSSLWKNGPAYPKNIGLLHQQQQHFKHNLHQHPTSLRTVLHQHSMPFTSMDTKAIETNPLPIHPTDKICNEVGSHYTHCTIRLLRITSYVLRFIGQLRKHTNHKQIQLTPQETYQMELDSLTSKNKARTALVTSYFVYFWMTNI